MEQPAHVPGVDPSRVATPAELAACLDGLRRRLGLSYEALEKAAANLARRPGESAWENLGKSTVGEIVTGKRVPTRGKLRTFLAACQVSIADLPLWYAAWQRANMPDLTSPAGRRITEVDADDLEVHGALHPRDAYSATLPAYIARPHDETLHGLVRAAMDTPPRSGAAVLVSGSTSGKTRACFETLHWADDRPATHSLAATGWRVWPAIHPVDPQRFLDELDRIGPQTVIWLNEAQRYLLEPDQNTAAAIAAELRTLLADKSKAPVLLLGTLWPEYRDSIMRRPQIGQPDLYAHARALIASHTISVPDTFTGPALAAARASTDTRLREAAEHAGPADSVAITQHLAGVPDLMDRYTYGTTTARAVLHAAIDARRLGHSEWLPVDLLRDAAPGYLDQREHCEHLLDPDWFTRALDELTAPRTARTRALYPPPATAENPQDTLVRLEDYLDQYGRQVRVTQPVPASTWDALATYTSSPIDRLRLAEAARLLGLYRHSASLLSPIAENGNTEAMTSLAWLLKRHNPKNAENWLRRAADAGDPSAMRQLADHLRESGRADEADQWLRDGAHTGDPNPMWHLAMQLQQAGRTDDAEHWLRRTVETSNNQAERFSNRGEAPPETNGGQHTSIHRANTRNDHTWLALRQLADLLKKDGRIDEAEHYELQCIESGDTLAMWNLGRRLADAGQTGQAEHWFRRAIEIGNSPAMRELAVLLERASRGKEAEHLLRQIAETDDQYAIYAKYELAELLTRTGQDVEAEHWRRLAARAGHSEAIDQLVDVLEQESLAKEAQHWLRSATEGSFTMMPIWQLVDQLQQAGIVEQVERWLRAAAKTGNSTAMRGLASLLETTNRHAEASQTWRSAAESGNTTAMQELANRLEKMGLADQAEHWLRQGARTDFNARMALTQLLNRAGRNEEAQLLNHFGLEPDGRTAEPW